MKLLPGVSLDFKEMGLTEEINSFFIKGMNAKAGDAISVNVENLSVKFKRKPLLYRKLQLEEIFADGIVCSIKTYEPIPESLTTPSRFKIPIELVTGEIETILITNLNTSVYLKILTNQIFVIETSNAVLNVGPTKSQFEGLPFAFSLFSDFSVNTGVISKVKASGQFDLEKISPEKLSFDLNLQVDEINMPDMNPILYENSPFLIKTGKLDYFMNMSCRDGKLDGLASIRTKQLTLLHNSGSIGTGFLRLSFDAWRFLVQQKKGEIEADCPISGTINNPNIPLGAVLKEQASCIARNIGIKMIECIPTSMTKNIAEKWETSEADKSRYENLFKISRLPPSEQHYEKGRHFYKIAKNHKKALDEFMLQVSEYPQEADIAVKALKFAASIQKNYLKNSNAAVDTLRIIVDRYRNHQDADDAMLSMIEIKVEAKQYNDALSLCEEFRSLFIHSEFVQRVAEIKRSIANMAW